LCAAWTRYRLGDAQKRGVYYDEPIIHGMSDLGTSARLLVIDAERALTMLAELRPPDSGWAARFARRKLNGASGTFNERKRLGIDSDRASELLEGAKEFIWWSCQDSQLELPVLPF